jgi:hypothetical protein
LDQRWVVVVAHHLNQIVCLHHSENNVWTNYARGVYRVDIAAGDS